MSRPDDKRDATAVYNQALLAADMGDLQEAGQLHERAIRLWWAGLGPNHPYVARGLDGLAEVMATSGQPAKARDLYERALALRDVRSALTIPMSPGLSPTSPKSWERPEMCSSLCGVSTRPLRFMTGPERGMSRTTWPGLSTSRHARSKAGGLLGRPRELRRSALVAGADVRRRASAGCAGSRRSWSADFALGATDIALSMALDAESVGRDHLRFTIPYLPERQAMAYAAKRPRGLDLALSIVAAGRAPEVAGTFDSVIRSRGVILDEIAARARSAAGADPALTPLNAAVRSARERFANLMLRSLEGEEAVPRDMLDEARRRKEEAEAALAERSVVAQVESARAHIGLQDIQRALPTGTTMVAFVRYERTMFPTYHARTNAHVIASSVAFVISAAGETVAAVPLGSAASLEAIVSSWRQQVDGQFMSSQTSADAEREYRTLGVALRRRIWDPLVDHLRGAAHVLIVPDGALNLVSFAALPIGGRKYLAENTQTIHLLATERGLEPGGTGIQGHGLLAVGGPTYSSKVGPVRLANHGTDCDSIGPLRFEDLPAARAEVRDVAQL